jgi:hypothetical protein
MSKDDFRVPGYDYSKHRYKTGHVLGHLIDHKDTMMVGQKEDWSTYDHRNYVPEPAEYEYGLGIRRLKVGKIRETGGAYAQLNVYTKNSLETTDGTLVPEDIRFYAYTLPNYTVDISVLHVEFEENMKWPKGQKVLDHAAASLSTSLASCPIVTPYSPDHTDREIRYHARDAHLQHSKISTSDIVSRFPEKDKYHSAFTAGDTEYETAGRKLNAGMTAYGAGNATMSQQYVRRSLTYGEKLAESEKYGKNLYTKDEAKSATEFLKEAGKKDDKFESFEDQFSKLCKDAHDK